MSGTFLLYWYWEEAFHCVHRSNLGMRLERKLRQGIGWLTSSCVEGPVLAPRLAVLPGSPG